MHTEMNVTIIQDKIQRLPNRPPCMLAPDLAEIYETKTSRINEAVKRNPDRFPADFYFQLTAVEAEKLVSQNAIPKQSITKETPFGFTREGANMLSAVLKTKVAAARAVQIMRAFAAMERHIAFEHVPFDLVTEMVAGVPELKEDHARAMGALRSENAEIYRQLTITQAKLITHLELDLGIDPGAVVAATQPGRPVTKEEHLHMAALRNRGYSTRQIAAELHRSVKTIRKYLEPQT